MWADEPAFRSMMADFGALERCFVMHNPDGESKVCIELCLSSKRLIISCTLIYSIYETVVNDDRSVENSINGRLLASIWVSLPGHNFADSHVVLEQCICAAVRNTLFIAASKLAICTQDYGMVEFSLPSAAESAKEALGKMRHGGPPPIKRMTVAEKKEEERRQEEAQLAASGAGGSADQQAAGASSASGTPVKVLDTMWTALVQAYAVTALISTFSANCEASAPGAGQSAARLSSSCSVPCQLTGMRM